MDFVSDALANGRALRALTVVDNFTKEAPAIEVDCSLSAPRVTRVLDQIIEARGKAPESIRIDNGPEFTSRCFLAWAEQRGIRLVHIQPGKPVQNAFAESFNPPCPLTPPWQIALLQPCFVKTPEISRVYVTVRFTAAPVICKPACACLPL